MAQTTLVAANVRITHDKARNLSRFLELTDEAGAAGADVLVLPEMGLQGYADFGFSVGAGGRRSARDQLFVSHDICMKCR